jgi:Predicted molecular chaperone distantly related to HSP70-fold metalloproteases
MSLHLLHSKKELRVLGIMNGTSLDGIDFVLTKIKKTGSKTPQIFYLAEKSFSFPDKLQSLLMQAATDNLKVYDLARLHHELGRFYAACFKKLPANMRRCDLIGLHGQTVFHEAPKATLQIGEASYLAAESKKPVIADFRVADLALGGQGAPIATLFHQVAFGKGERIAVHNLGGISNLSLITPTAVEKAFDTGPANMLMDLCIQKITHGKKHFDKDGKFARSGNANLALVEKLLAHKYFTKRPPKSCGREEFGQEFFNKFWNQASKLNDADKMATLLEFTAWSIALSYKKFVSKMPKRIIFCGGGANNTALLQRIQELLPEVKVETTKDYNWPVSSIEGAAFSLLAAYRVWGMPSNLPQTTGAKRKSSLGKFVEV